MDCSLPGFSVHGILQARILELVTISFSRDLLDPGIEPRSPALEADALTSEPPVQSNVEAWVQSLVKELRPNVPCGAAKKGRKFLLYWFKW